MAMKSSSTLRLVGIGCGNRTNLYLKLAAMRPQLYTITGAADPIPECLERAYEASGKPDGFRRFNDWRALLAEECFADVAIIGTQDADHLEPSLAAMERGYDLLLEKPIATRLADVLKIEQRANELGRRVLICHVLRYTSFYRKVKELVDSGILGDIVSLNATEGVGPWHQVHSFVRGPWAVTEKATPMIIAKSCHDLDVINWIVGRPCLEVSSYGSLTYFTKENAPAGAPERCLDGCPVGESCPYNAQLYTTKHRHWSRLLGPGEQISDSEIEYRLSRSSWGRCVYRCDNTAVDRQVVAMRFEGDATATFTMTAFDRGRNIEIFGTQGVLRAGEAMQSIAGTDIVVRLHDSDEIQRIDLPVSNDEYAGHGGGDQGLMLALYGEMRCPSAADMTTSLSASVQSHVMGFAAEASRVAGETMTLSEFIQSEITKKIVRLGN